MASNCTALLLRVQNSNIACERSSFALERRETHSAKYTLHESIHSASGWQTHKSESTVRSGTKHHDQAASASNLQQHLTLNCNTFQGMRRACAAQHCALRSRCAAVCRSNPGGCTRNPVRDGALCCSQRQVKTTGPVHVRHVSSSSSSSTYSCCTTYSIRSCPKKQ
jgi:hypothetical protein